MRILRSFLLAGVAAIGLAGAKDAQAANALVQNSTPAHTTTGPSVSSIATTFPASITVGHTVAGFAACWNAGNPPTVVSVQDDKGVNYPIADNFLGYDTSNVPIYRGVSYYILSAPAASSTITVTWSAACQYNNNFASEFSGSLQVLAAHSALDQNLVGAGSDAITSGNGTASVPGSLAFGATYSGSGIANTVGTGWTAGISDPTSYNSGYSEYRLNQGAGSLAATFGSSITTNSNMTALMVFSPGNLPTPKSAVCNQTGSQANNPTLPDSSLSGAVVCGYSVAMSDMSTFTGNVLVAQQGCSASCLFSTSSSTGNGNLTLARNAAVTDDGVQTALLNFHQNGVTVPLTVNLAVTAAPAAGTPMGFGFKGVNPGTSDTPQSGTVIFTAPHAMTVNAITGRVSAPIGGSGVQAVDVYKASTGTPCAGGVKLHIGDFNANGAIDVNQPLQLIADTTVTGNTHTTTTIDNLSANVLLRGWQAGDAISGSGIPANDTIASIAVGGLSLTLASAATTTVTADALTVPTPIAQGDNVCITTTGSQWTTPAAVDATLTVTAQ